jgi:uncharacterized protein (DUF58 family)
VTTDLSFTPTPRLRRLVMVAVLATVGAVATAHGGLLALAVVPLVVLVVVPRSQLPPTATVTARLGPLRCVEGDELVLELDLVAEGADRVEASLVLPPHTTATYEGPRGDAPRGATTVRWLLVPGRWGRHPVGPVVLRVVAGAGCYQARLTVGLEEIVVFPEAGALARSVAPRELAAPLGEHASRAVGSGVEFAGIRAYSPGDRRRDVDWRTSARHGDLFVRQYAAERAFDLVLVLDTGTDAGEPGESTLDLTVRAATGLAQTYLRSHDRVGLVTFGGPLRWLAPAAGPRQLYRVCEAAMSVRPDRFEREAGAVEHGLENLPRGMLPHRAFVAVVTPLLDDGPLDAVRVLRDRGFAPLVVDVLTTEPRARPGSAAALAVRVWRMHREALTLELGSLGVPVVPWDGVGDLTGALQHAMRASRPAPGTRVRSGVSTGPGGAR